MLDPLDHGDFQAVLGDILTLLIALEFNHTLQYVVKQSIIQTKVVLLIAPLAIVPKFIILDLKSVNPGQLLGLAAITLVLGAPTGRCASGTTAPRTPETGDRAMPFKPAALDHVNIYVRNAERAHRWYTDVFGLHTQDIATVPETGKMRGAFLACDPGHAHDIALFEVGEDAPAPQKGQVGLNHVAWRMATLEDLAEMYQRLKARGIPLHVADHTVSIGVYFSDPDGNGLEVYYELPRSEWRRDRPFTNSTEAEKGRFPGPWDEVLRPATAGARG